MFLAVYQFSCVNENVKMPCPCLLSVLNTHIKIRPTYTLLKVKVKLSLCFFKQNTTPRRCIGEWTYSYTHSWHRN